MRLYPVERGLNPPLQGLPALDTCLDSLFSCFGKFCFPGPLSRQLYRCPKQPTKTGGTRNSCLDRCSEQGETHQGGTWNEMPSSDCVDMHFHTGRGGCRGMLKSQPGLWASCQQGEAFCAPGCIAHHACKERESVLAREQLLSSITSFSSYQSCLHDFPHKGDLHTCHCIFVLQTECGCRRAV